MAHLLSLSPLRRIVKDYYMVCDSYYEAIRTATPERIEAIDMGRRALHDEGSQLLMERLKRKVDDRLRDRAPAVHADLRAALEGLTVDEGAGASRPRAVLFVCGLNSVRSPMAAALLRQMAGEGIDGRLGRRAQGRRSIRSRRPRWRRSASTSPSTSR